MVYNEGHLYWRLDFRGPDFGRAGFMHYICSLYSSRELAAKKGLHFIRIKQKYTNA